MDRQTLQNSPWGPTKCHHQQKDVTGAEEGWLLTCTTEQFSFLTLNIDLTLVVIRSQHSDPKCKTQQSQ